MRITTYSDYSLRLLMYLGVAPGGHSTIAEAAAHYGVSRTHMMKVAHQLGKAGYITTVRGRAGGLRLARPAGGIVVGDILRITENDFNIVPCFASATLCRITPSCVLKNALSEATSAFLRVLDGYTLADLIVAAPELRRDLELPPADGNHEPRDSIRS
jgi:Rrf2 family transcriptional regulator, nitric oxide-sensitive transcriptional repressor